MLHLNATHGIFHRNEYLLFVDLQIYFDIVFSPIEWAFRQNFPIAFHHLKGHPEKFNRPS